MVPDKQNHERDGFLAAVLSQVIAAMAPLSPTEDATGPMERILAILCPTCDADVALLVQRLDAVSVGVLASVPSRFIPDGLTTPAIFAGAIETGQSVYYFAEEAVPGLRRAVRGTTAVIPFGDRLERSESLVPPSALVLIRHCAEPFDVATRSLLESLRPILFTLARLQESLLRSEAGQARFDAMIQTLPHALVFTDNGGAEAWLNAAASELLGLPGGRVAPYLVAEAMAELRMRADNHTDIASHTAPLLNQMDASLHDDRWIFSNPCTVFNVSSVPTHTRTMHGRLWVFIDVTALYLVRQKLEENNAALDVARKQADAANTAKSLFLASMSHEIRTPMNGVLGMTELLLGTELSAEQRDFVDTIRKSGDMLLRLINDILDFSKVEAGLLQLDEHPFELRALLKETLDLCRNRALEKKLALGSYIASELPNMLIGDATRLRQILLNLIGNAVKFTTHGSVMVSLSVAPVQDIDLETSGALQRLRLRGAVRDTGVGIPEDRMNRLFQSFSQVHASTTRQYGGTGLGLAISKRLAELMGGRMWVESQDGVGSTFFFEVVCGCAIGELAVCPQESQPSERDALDATMGKRMPLRILLADDSATNQRVAVMQLRQLGYQTDVVENGKQVLQAFERAAYDVLLLDLQMPELDGIAAARCLRAMLAEKQKPYIVAVTADVIQGTRELCFEAGMNDFIAKPMHVSELAEALKRASAYLRTLEFRMEITRLGAATALDPSAWEQLSNLADGDAELLRELVSDHLANAALLIDKLRHPLTLSDSSTLARLANSLRSVALILGAVDLATLCQKLFDAALAQSAGSVNAALEAIDSSYTTARKELERRLRTLHMAEQPIDRSF